MQVQFNFYKSFMLQLYTVKSHFARIMKLDSWRQLGSKSELQAEAEEVTQGSANSGSFRST
jgi:hypothetical protein